MVCSNILRLDSAEWQAVEKPNVHQYVLNLLDLVTVRWLGAGSTGRIAITHLLRPNGTAKISPGCTSQLCWQLVSIFLRSWTVLPALRIHRQGSRTGL